MKEKDQENDIQGDINDRTKVKLTMTPYPI